ncbi:MAG: glycosyltransferase [Bryobacterales bacterium]|nr:glycosyltransferase [Bryobacterales bacterium]
MRFSLIVATAGARTEALARMLTSVAVTPEAAAGCLEVIVADQNLPGVLDTTVAPFRHPLHLMHLHTALGLSRSRNEALPHASGDVIVFPDDDCVYEPGTLGAVRAVLTAQPELAGVCGMVATLEGRPFALRWPTASEPVTKRRVWRQAMSSCIFLRRHATDAAGLFDETLGLGAGTPWISGEETDYLLRVLAAGFPLRFDPAIRVRHPQPAQRFNEAGRARAYGYALGMGRVLKQHRFPWVDAAYYCARPALGSAAWLLRGRLAEARYYAKVARGRMEGWLSA